MNIQRAQKRITLYVILPALTLYVGIRLFAQYRHVDLYVSRQTPMPAELAEGLHMEEHKIDPIITIESPYENAANKILTSAEIRRLRSALAWSRAAFVDSISIQSPTRVLARRKTARFIYEYQVVQFGDQWLIDNATRSELQRH
jgi:hypothetical protein